MMNYYTLCEECTKFFKLDAEMYIGNAPVPQSISEEGHFSFDNERLVETHIELYIDNRRKLKVPTYSTIYIFKTKCPECGHQGEHEYLIRERQLKESTIELIIERYRILEEDNAALRIELKRQTHPEQRNPLVR